MKRNGIFSASALLSTLFLVSSCAVNQTTVEQDDVYAQRSRAVDRGYQSPDYYYDGQTSALSEDQDFYADEYSDEEYFDGDQYYEDEYFESEYADRFNRFYYSGPNSFYFDPWIDLWSPYAMYGWNGYRYYNYPFYNSMSFGFRANRFGLFYDPFFSFGHFNYFYSPLHRHLYYGSPYWGAYSYYNYFGNPWMSYPGGYGPIYGGGGYYNGRNMSVRSAARDMQNTRSGGVGTRNVDGQAIARDANGRIINSRLANNGRVTGNTQVRGNGTRDAGQIRSVQSNTNRGNTQGVRNVGTTRTTTQQGGTRNTQNVGTRATGTTRNTTNTTRQTMSTGSSRNTGSGSAVRNSGSSTRSTGSTTRSTGSSGGSTRSTGSSTSRGNSGGRGSYQFQAPQGFSSAIQSSPSRNVNTYNNAMPNAASRSVTAVTSRPTGMHAIPTSVNRAELINSAISSSPYGSMGRTSVSYSRNSASNTRNNNSVHNFRNSPEMVVGGGGASVGGGSAAGGGGAVSAGGGGGRATSASSGGSSTRTGSRGN
jgi:hypothetical protein